MVSTRRPRRSRRARADRRYRRQLPEGRAGAPAPSRLAGLHRAAHRLGIGTVERMVDVWTLGIDRVQKHVRRIAGRVGVQTTVTVVAPRVHGAVTGAHRGGRERPLAGVVPDGRTVVGQIVVLLPY